MEQGFLLIADVTGYTSFLTGTELEHAHAIIEDLMHVLLGAIEAPFRVVKLEGDAIFYYAPPAAMPDAERLLDHIDRTYGDFRSRLHEMRRATTCGCSACRAIPSLDLKFFVHFGDYIEHRPKGLPPDLAGPSVIVLHRLLKNHVELRAYALITEAAAERIGNTAALAPHVEEYEHVGTIRCGLYDVGEAERRAREARVVRVEEGEGDVAFERVVETSAETLWSWNVDPNRRLQWQGDLAGIRNSPNAQGRFAEGAEIHCDHGSYSRVNKVVDWRPFRYFTVQCTFKPAWKYPPGFATFEFTPLPGGKTRVSFRFRSTRRDWFTLNVVRRIAQRMVSRQFGEDYDRLERLLPTGDISVGMET